MNRIERLTAILLLLQRGKLTASEIARHFEVSKRTIQRDIDALCEMGIPIAAELGIAGGYTLPSDYSLPPLALTFHEALLLRLALSSLSQLGETPFKRARESLLTKVQTLLPKSGREALDQATQRLSFALPSRPYTTPFLDDLLESARQEQWLAVTYRSETGVSQQTLLPLHIRTEMGLWYCEAFSVERNDMRVYRVDRFLAVNVAPTPPQVERPAPAIAYVHLSYPEVRLRLTARGILKVEHEPHLAAYLQPQAAGDGIVTMRLRPAEYDWLVNILLKLGIDATVLAPDELRRRVRQKALEIAHHFAE